MTCLIFKKTMLIKLKQTGTLLVLLTVHSTYRFLKKTRGFPTSSYDRGYCEIKCFLMKIRGKFAKALLFTGNSFLLKNLKYTTNDNVLDEEKYIEVEH